MDVTERYAKVRKLWKKGSKEGLKSRNYVNIWPINGTKTAEVNLRPRSNKRVFLFFMPKKEFRSIDEDEDRRR